MKKPILTADKPDAQYQAIFSDVSRIVDAARQSAARSVNAVMTAAYWLIGRHIVEFEQSDEQRADYGEEIVERLATDLSAQYGRGFSTRNVWNMKAFYLAWPILQTVSAESSLDSVASHFPLPCYQSRTRAPVNSTKPRPCAAVGRFANSTGRLILSSINAPHCRRIRPYDF